MEKVNVYDWDKTIFPVDSTVAFVRWCLRRHPGVIWPLLRALALLPGYWLGKISKTAVKERMYGFLRRVPDVDAELEAFWAKNFPRVNAWYLAQQRPDDIIISASPEFLVRIPAQKLGVRLLASRVDKHTGKTDGENCHGAEKVRRLHEAYPEVQIAEFYSDSRSDSPLAELAERAYSKRKRAANAYRHRAIVWGVQSHFYMDFLVWLLNCWGIVPLTDMLSMVSTRELATTDTPENREQAYYDMAWLTENMIMRNRTHGGYKVLLDELWEFCEEFNADMVILWEHMSCKALDGMHGLFEERAREHGIHLVWVTHDLFDPRVISRQGVRQQVNDYMRTVMQEEPVDPSLEILKDEKSW